jgi:hypothetical protein
VLLGVLSRKVEVSLKTLCRSQKFSIKNARTLIFAFLRRQHDGFGSGSRNRWIHEGLFTHPNEVASAASGVQKIKVEGDAQAIINDINKEGRQESRYGHIIDDIKVLLLSLHRMAGPACTKIGELSSP